MAAQSNCGVVHTELRDAEGAAACTERAGQRPPATSPERHDHGHGEEAEAKPQREERR